MKKQNKKQFVNVIEQNKRIIYKVCNSYCKNPDDRPDLAQEILIQVWKSLPSYNEEYKLSTWIYRIALNTAISFYRIEQRKKIETTPLDEEFFTFSEIDENSEQAENVKLLYGFINSLDDMNRALMLLYLDEHSYKEIGAILGITETNVASKINRIKKKIREEFNKIEKEN